MNDQRQFLDLVYGTTPGLVDIVTLDEDGRPASEKWFQFPDELTRATNYLSMISDLDVFCSVSLFSERKRTNTDPLATGHALGVDADTCHPDNFRIPPTIRVQTGENRWHCWWVLDQTESAADIATVVKKIATAHEAQGCDKAHTHFSGKLLRVPGTQNSHHEDWEVKVEFFPDNVYPLDTLDEAYADIAVGSASVRQQATITSDKVVDFQFSDDELERLREYSRVSWDEDLRTLKVGMVPGSWHTTAYQVACNMFRNANLPWSEFSHPDVGQAVNQAAQVDSQSSQRELDRILRDASDSVGSTLLMLPAWAVEMIPDTPPPLLSGSDLEDAETVAAQIGLTNDYVSVLRKGDTATLRTLKFAGELFQKTSLPVVAVLSLCANMSVNTFKNSRPLTEIWSEVQLAKEKSEEPPAELSSLVKTLELPSFLTEDEEAWLKTEPKPFPHRYTDWVQKQSAAAPIYSQTLAWILLSAIYSDRGYIPFKWHPRTPLNLWALILGDTTRTYKTTALRIAMRLLHAFESETGMRIDIGSNTTSEGILKALGERNGLTSLIHTDEVNGFFREALTKNYQTGVVETFTDLYEGHVPVSLRATKGAGNPNRADTQFCFAGVGIRETVALVLTREHFASGFLPRAVWAVADPPPVSEAFPPLEMQGETGAIRDSEFEDLKEELVFGWNKWKSPVSVKFPEAEMKRLNDFNLTAQTLAATVGDPQVVSASAARLVISCTKAAALLALHEGSEIVKMRHVLFAIYQGQFWFRDMVRMSREVSASEFERRLDDMERYLLEGVVGVRTDLQVRKRFANFRPQEISEILQALGSQGRVKKIMEEGVVKWQSLEL